MATRGTSQEIRFSGYSLDVRTGELRLDGVLLKLQQQPAKILALLAAHPGEVVTRQELAKEVWGSETYVDFEHGLNYAIQQIRSVLDDDPKTPRFVETVPKRGYRFVAPLTESDAPERPEPPLGDIIRPTTSSRWHAKFAFIAAIAVTVMIVAYVALRYSRSSSARTAVGIKSIAVLPLRNLSNDAAQEYFTDGMTDELITDLAKSGSLRVISHTSVERYKNTRIPLPEIAEQLGVDAIVEGSVMRSGNDVRITAQLIDARSDRHVWADTYKGDLRDVFTLQGEVAQHIAYEIGVNLKATNQPTTKPYAPDPKVHEAYLRGNFYWNQLNCEGFRKAKRYFDQAAEGDRQFARAYVGLAEADFTLADWGCSADLALIPEARQAAERALELDPSLGEAHAWLGKIAYFYEWNVPKAEQELRRAIDLSPNYPEAHMIYSVLLVGTGRQELGLGEMKKARELDPISQLPNVISVVVLYLARRYDDAIEQGKKTIELYPDSVAAYDWLEYAYEKRALEAEAGAAFLKAQELRGKPKEEMSLLRMKYQKNGIRGLWQRELESAQTSASTNPCWMAKIEGHLGNMTQATIFLKQASERHCSGPHTTLADPVFDELRGSSGFKEIEKGLNSSERPVQSD